MAERRRNELLRSVKHALRLPLHRRAALLKLAAFHAAPRTLDEIVDAAVDLGSRGLVRVRASQRRPEIRELARRVAELEPRNVLEIGTFLGGTLLLWSQLATRRVISCDLRIPRVRRALYRRFPRPGSGCEVVLLEGDSHSPAFRGRVVDALEGEPVDFLFVDGDHSESGVEADYRDYAPLVRPGGLIAFHDIVERQPTPETAVHAFWRRLRASVAATELVEDPAQVGFGIGVVQVGAREAPAASER